MFVFWYLVDTLSRIWYLKGIYLTQKYLLPGDGMKENQDFALIHKKYLDQKKTYLIINL